jgi:hypothetical protein
VRLQSLQLAGTGIAQIGAGPVAAGFGGFSFSALVFSDFFFGIGVGIAGGKHRVRATSLLFLFADFAKLMANLAKRRFDGLDLNQQVTDFFEKVVEVERPDYVGEASKFQGADELAAAGFRNEVKDAKAGPFRDSDAA